MKARLSLLTASLLLASAAQAANVAPSQLPPQDIAIEQAPVFVAIAFDDNEQPVNGSADATLGGQAWVLDLWGRLRNPAGSGNLDNYDGQSLKTTFFNTCNYIASSYWNAGNIKNSWRAAYEAGHEVGNHTIDHLWGGAWMDTSVWSAQIDGCNQMMQRPYNAEANPWAADDADGIGASASGFRTPYLDYNAALFEALSALGMRYDASIGEGYHWEHHGGNNYWPYTLDNGSPGADLVASWGVKPAIGQYPGLWEVPVYAMTVPADELMADYGIDYSLRAKIKAKIAYFDTNSGKIESSDYNLFYQLGLTGPEVLAILKHSLDLRVAGNHAPMTLLAHSGQYADLFDNWVPTTTTAAERRAVIEEFLEYALSHDAVRVVSHAQLLDWMEAPQALDAEHCYHANWKKGRQYQQGQKVLYQGQLWQANWWSYNSVPQQENWGPWQAIMACPAP